MRGEKGGVLIEYALALGLLVVTLLFVSALLLDMGNTYFKRTAATESRSITCGQDVVDQVKGTYPDIVEACK